MEPKHVAGSNNVKYIINPNNNYWVVLDHKFCSLIHSSVKSPNTSPYPFCGPKILPGTSRVWKIIVQYLTLLKLCDKQNNVMSSDYNVVAGVNRGWNTSNL